jgi:thioredoxin reductase (NADPH)
MHYAALLGDYAKEASHYGWRTNNNNTHDWNLLKTNVQDHIKGLNFGYRVELRENGVTYLNKLGRFLSAHELEVVDAKGNKEVITGARFVIATGGRPTPLAIPGGELAISSDDLFSLRRAPGKTLVIGAGYVALECGGFLAGLDQGKVTILVRSKPLRTFDQDTVKYVIDYMKHQGKSNLDIVEKVIPKSITKLPSGQLRVVYGRSDNDRDDITEDFDTVLTATGRIPELSGLGLENIEDAAGNRGLRVHSGSGKLLTTNEQTSVDNIYAIGDIIHDGIELTPVAILAGKLLARRLFANAEETIDYRNIPSAVFTPLELGTVGYSEEDAIATFGANNVDCYLSEFQPLEWTLIHEETEGEESGMEVEGEGASKGKKAFVKVVVKRDENDKVIGMHIAAPGASEIIQGYAIAMRQGLTYKALCETIGIHPTIGEELTLLKTTKSSGGSFGKTGC